METREVEAEGQMDRAEVEVMEAVTAAAARITSQVLKFRTGALQWNFCAYYKLIVKMC